jgi:hypothetical protein
LFDRSVATAKVILSNWNANVDIPARFAEGRHGFGERDYCTTPGKVEPNCFWTNLARCASPASMIENWSTPANAKISRLRVHASPHSMSRISSHAVSTQLRRLGKTERRNV